MTPSIRSEIAEAVALRRSGATALRAASMAAACAVLALGGPAAADEPQARRQFERAQQAYKLGNYQRAIEGYEAAYRELPLPAFLFNIAQSYRLQHGVDGEVSHLRKALALYGSYLREAKDPPNRQTVLRIVNELRTRIDELDAKAEKRQKAGLLLMRGEIGARVLIDGNVFGTLPLNAEVAPGTHALRVELPGHEPWTSTVRVSAGAQIELPVAFEPQRAPQQPAQARRVPFYRRWWFWTIAGAVVAAGAGTGIYFATRGDGGDGMPQIDLR
jgi:hypothetical protein